MQATFVAIEKLQHKTLDKGALDVESIPNLGHNPNDLFLRDV